MMDSDDDDLVEDKISHYLWIIVPPILIIFGTIGNLLSILVMSRRGMRSSNAAVYLIALALADTGALWFGLVPPYVKEITGRLNHVPEPICKVNVWLMYVSLSFSVWILVAFTIERFVSVFVPHKVKTYCTQTSSIIVVLCIMVNAFAYNSHLLYGFGDATYQHGNISMQVECNIISEDYDHFVTYVLPWLDFCVTCFIPLVVFIVCNSCIAVRVLLRRRNMRKITGAQTARHPSHEALAATSRRDNSSRLTIMLFTVTIVFLVTTAPVRLFLVMKPWVFKQTRTYKEEALTYLLFNVIIIFIYINNSVNFILYCVTGSRFRNELLNMLRKLRTKTLKKNQTNDLDKECSRRPSLIVRQTPSAEVAELPNEGLLPLQCRENQCEK